MRVSDFAMLSKALNAPPEKWHGLQDVETRYRQRYADLIANEEVAPDLRDPLEDRLRRSGAFSTPRVHRGRDADVAAAVRRRRGTAVHHPHHALDQTFYLRIADELYLKRLIVGGFERVYEICKDFRNEGDGSQPPARVHDARVVRGVLPTTGRSWRRSKS